MCLPSFRGVFPNICAHPLPIRRQKPPHICTIRIGFIFGRVKSIRSRQSMFTGSSLQFPQASMDFCGLEVHVGSLPVAHAFALCLTRHSPCNVCTTILVSLACMHSEVQLCGQNTGPSLLISKFMCVGWRIIGWATSSCVMLTIRTLCYMSMNSSIRNWVCDLYSSFSGSGIWQWILGVSCLVVHKWCVLCDGLLHGFM